MKEQVTCTDKPRPLPVLVRLNSTRGNLEVQTTLCHEFFSAGARRAQLIVIR